mmetsp:Transcript_67394/g.132955  ORF Transcript_67394/g.132955 Transcript_67394/m.132955 type:complete len:344 (+) Transcript_67394:621-1652(+)
MLAASACCAASSGDHPGTCSCADAAVHSWSPPLFSFQSSWEDFQPVLLELLSQLCLQLCEFQSCLFQEEPDQLLLLPQLPCFRQPSPPLFQLLPCRPLFQPLALFQGACSVASSSSAAASATPSSVGHSSSSPSPSLPPQPLCLFRCLPFPRFSLPLPQPFRALDRLLLRPPRQVPTLFLSRSSKIASSACGSGSAGACPASSPSLGKSGMAGGAASVTPLVIHEGSVNPRPRPAVTIGAGSGAAGVSVDAEPSGIAGGAACSSLLLVIQEGTVDERPRPAGPLTGDRCFPASFFAPSSVWLAGFQSTSIQLASVLCFPFPELLLSSQLRRLPRCLPLVVSSL